eukprot:TRINITY_DN90192_c0_g1_i1.p1 TRINITY_DN90192_c0_g1~~TRINITY_DN90192_c0_g1_i1.p1  ORF type:complete len:822 (+),score=227.75 TRINITY_DN90192_c0_g1_i1:178-2643(+)
MSETTVTTAAPVPICKGGQGLLLPLGGDAEADWPKAVKIVLYFMGLLWCFMGVAIIADVFMGAIERVTSKKVLRLNKKTGKMQTFKIWNDTVANLTLMALGSSAPEILLSVIGLVGNDFKSEDLGPSTIVGSAAFNLLCISAVCVSALPVGETRIIRETTVFAITAIFSIFAYVWLLIILIVITPDVVDIAEGVLTFVFFPMLVVIAWLADIGVIGRHKARSKIVGGDMTAEELAQAKMKIEQVWGNDISEEQLEELLAYEYAPTKSRALYRVAATRSMLKNNQEVTRVAKPPKIPDISKMEAKRNSTNSDKPKEGEVAVAFAARKHTMLESVGKVNIRVTRSGETNCQSVVKYKTRDGGAKAGSDYKETEGELTFKERELFKTFEVEIVDDDEHEKTECFYVDLFDHQVVKGAARAVLGLNQVEMVIVDDDLPGMLSFSQDQLTVEEAAEAKELEVTVKRDNGGSGKISVSYYTEPDSAKAGYDYEHVAGSLEFEPGQMSATFKIKIMPKGRYEGTEMFRVYLKDPEGGATFNPKTDGGSAANICTVIIKADDKAKATVDKLMVSMKANWDNVAIGNANWAEQFTGAIFVNGSLEAQKEAGIMDWVMHVVGFPWKLFFAIVPPADYCNGWLCFVVALLFIGVVTAVIGDMAALLGCSLGISESVTAITLVALGTSLPDTFASMTAAQQDPSADASVGNVTGSNSVNVFLGLGLPWSIGAFYWTSKGQTQEWLQDYGHLHDGEMALDYPDGGFVVSAGTLGPSVAVFCVCAVLCLAILVSRRKLAGGELGGPKGLAYGTSAFFVFLWAVYIGLSVYFDSSA